MTFQSFLSFCINLLTIKGELEDVIKAIKKINVRFVVNYNIRHDTIGHVFQDRYKSMPIESDKYLLGVVRYIHLNPVKANIIKDVEQYKWSSYNEYINNKNINDSRQLVLSFFNNDLIKYKAFHDENDNTEYLEIKEDMIAYRIDRAQRIIEKYCKEHGMITRNEVLSNPIVLDNVISELRLECKLTFRKIGELLEMPYNTVYDRGKGII